MDKIKNLLKNKKSRRIIALVCVVVLVIGLAAMPLIAKKKTEEGPQASILTGTVEIGSLNTELIGGGTLALDDPVAVSVPTEVKLTGFLVSNGETVTKGTALATVDRVTVMSAITQVQDTLEELSSQIQAESSQISRETISALAGGTVKILYAQPGDSVQSVMLEHGSLAVLSLDGLMAVDLTVESDFSVGTAVTVTLSDGRAVTGKIAKNLAGSMTVTVEDDSYETNQTVTVAAEDGTVIGTGKLYIYSPWNATAYAGTVDSVSVSEGDQLSTGKTLMVLIDVGYSATYRQLISQRQEYEDMMLQLFEMYQTETLLAPCDGVVSGIDKNSVQLLAAQTEGYSLSLLANAPNGNDQTLYTNYAVKVTSVAENGWVLQVNPTGIPVADYLQLTEVKPDEKLMTKTVLDTHVQVPVFALKDGGWETVERSTIGEGDILLFASDEQKEPVWSVLLQKGSTQEPGNPGGTETPGGSIDPGDTENPGGSTFPGGSSAQPDFSYPSGNFGDMSGTQQEEQLYSLDMAQVAAVTPQDTVTLDITIDEKDINRLQVGMTAQVKVNALGGEKYTATVSQIGAVGTNNGGSSKYTVELTLERGENMLAGMNATATIVLSTVSEVLTIPADALVEQGNQTLVYTGYNEKKDILLNPVAVQVGASDGEMVEILSGLSAGQTYYYAYYDTLQISAQPDFGGGGMFGR